VELPTPGRGDFRVPGVAVRQADGGSALELVHQEHRFFPVRGGDELMSVGLFLDDRAWEAQARGDFQARIFELEVVP
jgi:hypothetical protein